MHLVGITNEQTLPTIETNNIAFEAKVILGLESTCPDGQGAKIGLNDSNDQ